MKDKTNIGGELYTLMWICVNPQPKPQHAERIFASAPGLDFENGCPHNLRAGYWCPACAEKTKP